MKSAKYLQKYLDDIFIRYNKQEYLNTDPLTVVHSMKGRKNREVIGFLVSVFSFGNVTSIIRSVNRILCIMKKEPYLFIMKFHRINQDDFKICGHRFIKPIDIRCLLNSLSIVLSEYESIENLFMKYFNESQDMKFAISSFSKEMQRIYSTYNKRFREKSVKFMFPIPSSGSASKRMNLFLRWMVRKDEIDLGLWKKIETQKLIIPLDTHIARISKSLGLTKRKTVCWNMAEEITGNLKKFDPRDPIKYDFALTRVGMLQLS